MKQRRAVLVSGNHPVADVNKALRGKNASFKSCYDLALKASPALKGALTVRFTVSAGGQVSDAKPQKNEVGPIVGNCVAQQIKTLGFPKADGPSVFDKTYRFQPAE
jgi:hypothetical protein